MSEVLGGKYGANNASIYIIQGVNIAYTPISIVEVVEVEVAV